jgi:hypothetical protein
MNSAASPARLVLLDQAFSNRKRTLSKGSVSIVRDFGGMVEGFKARS